MRPLKLTMSAFGPYANETTIKFDKLGDRGVYLITGDTGAGKTMIFDAIVFALYGETSSDDREAKLLRSKYADPKTKTFVELFFQNGGKRYQIKRNPSYLRPKERGEGFTNEAAASKLILPDGSVIASNKAVDSAVRDILGIDRDQFLQIAMIAQGDFKKLLTASTEKRKEIFRRLFKTENYSHLQERLKSEYLRVKNSVARLNDSIRQYIGEIVCTSDSPYAEQITAAKENALPVSQTAEILGQMNADDADALGQLNAQLEALEKQLAGVNSALGKAEEYLSAKEEREKLAEDISAQSEQLAQELQKLEKAAAEAKQVDKLTGQSNHLTAELPKYDELELCAKTRDDLKELLNKSSGDLHAKKEQSDRILTSLDTMKKETSALDGTAERKAKLEAEKNSLNDKLNYTRKLLEQLQELTSKREKYEAQRLQCEHFIAEAKGAAVEYAQMNAIFLREQAGILAKDLADGEPCPVCGSDYHPHKAEISGSAPSEEELKAFELRQKKAQENAAEQSGLCAQYKGEFETLSDTVKKQLSEQDISADIEEAFGIVAAKLNGLKASVEEIDEKIAAEEKNLRKLTELRRTIPEKEAAAEALKEETAALEKLIVKTETTLDSTEQQYAKLRDELTYPDKAAAVAYTQQLGRRIADLKSAVDTAQTEVNNRNAALENLKGRHQTLSEQLSNAEALNAEELTQQIDGLTAQKTQLSAQRDALNERLSANCKLFGCLGERLKESERLEKQYQFAKTLSDTANGDMTGKSRVMLEAYIQTAYFDRIIARANTRLMVMSDGQYEMKRRVEADNKRSQSGLDLDVIDHYNGSERSAGSLSGGESFKASLSLALGLSDEVQSSAGGIRLESMFVDEGFGTLDGDSLEFAVNALVSLSENNRLVGIISHVDALKERIDKQIIIKKDRADGSRAEIVVG